MGFNLILAPPFIVFGGVVTYLTYRFRKEQAANPPPPKGVTVPTMDRLKVMKGVLLFNKFTLKFVIFLNQVWNCIPLKTKNNAKLNFVI